MPFSLAKSGTLSEVISGAKTEAEKQHKALGDNSAAKKGLELVHKFLDCLRSVVTEFPDNSDSGLVIAGDAGENHLTIHTLNFSASKPVAPADLEAHPVPVNGEEGSNLGVPVKEDELPPPEQPTTATVPPGTF